MENESASSQRNSLASLSPGDRPTQELLQLHIAEYQALTTRCTYFIALHIGLWGVVVSAIVFTIQQWFGSRNALFLWVGAAGVQALLHLWTTILEEQYIATSYIENHLRHSIVSTVPNLPLRSFWRYEVVASHRTLHENWWGEWITPGLASIGLIIVVVFRSAALYHELVILFSVMWRLQVPRESIPAAVNVVLLAFLWFRTYQRLTVRRTFTAAFKPLST